MASKKDFSTLNTGRVYNAIAEATAEPEAQEVQQAQEQPEARVRYTEAQKAEYLNTGKTRGRPGIKMARINMAFTTDNYEYIKTMSTVRGQTITDFVNHIIKQSREDNAEVYEQAKAFKKAF